MPPILEYFGSKNKIQPIKGASPRKRIKLSVYAKVMKNDTRYNPISARYLSRSDSGRRFHPMSNAPPETTAITLTNAAKPKERTPFALDAQSINRINA